MVSGIVQVNARVPAAVSPGAVPLTLTVGNFSSYSGATVCIAGATGADRVGPLIDAKLEQTRHEAIPAPLPEIPTDRSPIPATWLALVSWNVQVGSTNTEAVNPRTGMVGSALSRLFGGTYQLLAAQEIPNASSAGVLSGLLPGGSAHWSNVFIDTTDDMDNGIWSSADVVLRDSFLLFGTGQRDDAGRIVRDSTRSVHPPVVAQFQAGDFDFTLISLHLTFDNGNRQTSLDEFKRVLDYLDWYFNQPDHDPDVIVCGDFNLPSDLSGEGGLTLEQAFRDDPRFQAGERRFVETVHEPMSRSPVAGGGLPAHNYDHCVLSADTMEEFIQARRVSTNILTDDPEDPEMTLTSDHFPIVSIFRTRGDGVSLDNRSRMKPN